MSLSNFLRLMRSLPTSEVDPPMIFQPLEASSPLLTLFFVPSPLVPPSKPEIWQELRPPTTRMVEFYVGPPLSGQSLQYRRAAFDWLIYGRKKWLLIPPRDAYFSNKHIHRFLHDDYQWLRGAAPVFECVQEAGDILLIPDFWSHASIHLQESVGFMSEFLWGASEFSV
eukprot:TRINITY_DN4991_c0_g1_i7.p1 TRINITY_DN4991_c0_g1~~TRINITY_DN4991_c0_g1_i7.p1  ORF type:complete len:169 (-),score=53.99 TRINITY_DN4991_c0_g1_i7:54-560(-)